MGTFIVLVVLGVAVALAVRSLYKQHKSRSGCSGDCCGCSGCH